ncbi:MAG: filamentous hemagglutinin family protein, partial [Roseimicrobium sp.]
FLLSIDNLFNETGATSGQSAVLQTKQALHAARLLHSGDATPVRLYAGAGDISGLTLFTPKPTQVFAGRDLTDIAFYLQNTDEESVSVVTAGRDIVAYNANSASRVQARATGNMLVVGETTLAGDIQINGPGTLEVLAGRNLDLGTGPNNADGTGLGITSVGNARNPYLPFDGASIIVGAGIGASSGLGGSELEFDNFIENIVKGANGTRYLSELAEPAELDFTSMGDEEQRRRALAVFFIALRDAGRDKTALGTNYEAGFAAIDALFPGSDWKGDIFLTAREIKTRSGGDISVFAPGGKVLVGLDQGAGQALDQGILTEHGGSISIFANGSVDLGTSRIFTLRGGDITIWSSTGDIAAGSSSKTVQSAPPTRVIIDPQSGNVQTDLAGLATGGGIGVLATVAGVPPGNVDLIAPVGVVDAGDAGIRATGNLNIAATRVLNADNIQVAGVSTGTPTVQVVAAPNIGGLAAASSAAGSNTAAADAAAKDAKPEGKPSTETVPSIIMVEVLGYGGEDPEGEEEEKKKARRE